MSLKLILSAFINALHGKNIPDFSDSGDGVTRVLHPICKNFIRWQERKVAPIFGA